MGEKSKAVARLPTATVASTNRGEKKGEKRGDRVWILSRSVDSLRQEGKSVCKRGSPFERRGVVGGV